MQDALLAVSRPLVTPEGEPIVTVILDRCDELGEVSNLARRVVTNGHPIEVRVSLGEPARGTVDTVAEVAVIVQQLVIGAAGSGVWAGVEMIVRSAFSRRSASARIVGEPELKQTLTVVIPTPDGPALVQRVSIGTQDLDASQLSVERIVRALIDGRQGPPQANT